MEPVEVSEAGGVVQGGVRVEGVEAGAGALPPTEVEFHGTSERGEVYSIEAVGEGSDLAFDTDTELDERLGQVGACGLVLGGEGVDLGFAVLAKDADAAGVFFEHAKTGQLAIGHACRVEGGGDVEGRVGEHLGEGVAGVEEVGSGKGLETEPAGALLEGPMEIVGIVVPLPLQAEEGGN